MAPDKQKSLNIVMLPLMAQGHIIPFLALALHIEKTQSKNQSFTITLVNTPKNILNLRSSLPPESSIKLLEIPFESSDHGLPPGIENSDSLPYPFVIRLLEATASLQEPFRKILTKLRNEENSSVCVIGDIFMGWVGKVCKELGLFSAVFSGAGAFGLGCYRSFWLNLPLEKTEKDHFFFQDFPEAGQFHRTQLNSSMLQADGADEWSVFQQNNFSGWDYFDAILFNTVSELDNVGLSYFQKEMGIPVWAIGPILLSSDKRIKSKVQTKSLKTWLDSKPDNSVLYICFGSMNTISQALMFELAKALEASEKNFLWVVRPPIGFDINGDFNAKEWLPEGFEERMKESGRGLIIEKWVSQLDILSHTATSAFMSHCGWNSTVESLSHGVPILGWPMAGEQFFNSKFLQESLGVSVEVVRGKNCDTRWEDIVSKINLVMEENEVGDELRKRAKMVKQMIERAMEDGKEMDGYGKGSSLIGMSEFFAEAMSNKGKGIKEKCNVSK